MLGQRETIQEFQNRFPILYYGILSVFCVLTLRLGYLQLLRGKDYREFSEKNSLRKEKLTGPRGQVLDRNYKVLVDNRLQMDIVATPQFVHNPQSVMHNLAEISGQPEEQLYELYLNKTAGAPKFQPVTIVPNAPWPLVVKIESAKEAFSGIEVEPRIRRTYVNGQVGAHLFGYLNEVNKKDLEQQGPKSDYSLGDWIGRSGLERKWERYLRGVDGARFVEVDAHGHRVVRSREEANVLSSLQRNIPSKPGHNLVLTIDEDLENVAAEAMKGKMGAVVALDPRTGEVLTMLSQPAFDSTDLAERGPEMWQSFMNNQYGPLRNKTLQDHFPAGSTFKPFTALAALENNVITPNTIINCPGHYKFGRRIYNCHKRAGHGPIDLLRAISGSCDVFFYTVATRLSIDQISKVASDFGLGHKSGIELDNERTGLMPTEEWKQKTFGEPWTAGETLSAAIGQSYNLVTPLQLAVAYSTLINGGNLYRPYVVSRIEDISGQVVKDYTPELVSHRNINPDHLAVIKQALFDVVNKPGGTAYMYARTPESLISGKSGTVELRTFSRDEQVHNCMTLPFEQRHHAWFVGYAPRENPEIVVSVLAMHECGGSKEASPVVKAVIEKWWQKKKEQEMLKGPMPAITPASAPGKGLKKAQAPSADDDASNELE